MREPIKIGIHQIENKFIGVAIHQGKLVANSFPRDSYEEALEETSESVGNKYGLDYEIDNNIGWEFASVIFAISKGMPSNLLVREMLGFHLLPKKKGDILKALTKVEKGTVVSYRELAILAGLSPKHARYVGNVMATNPMPLIVPCHRVVRSDRKLGNYSGMGGTLGKKHLLNLEGAKL